MPVIHFTRVPDGTFPFLSDELQSLMLFPSDPAQRESARATLVLARLARSGGEIRIDAATVTAALAGEGLEKLRAVMAKRVIRGRVAGDILLRLRAMRQDGDVPNVNECVRQLEKELAVYATFGGAKTKGYGDRSIETAWSEYRSVSHYWAASLMLLQRLREESQATEGPPWLADVLAGAQWSDVMNRHPDRVIAGAVAILNQEKSLQVESATGSQFVFDEHLYSPWIPSDDFPMPPRPMVDKG